MAFQKVLLKGQSLAAYSEKRLLPSLEVGKWDRLHFHISGGSGGVEGLSVRILFGTPVDGKILLTDSTVWFEETVSEREFSFTTPSTYNGTGFVMSVPVVAPLLYDVILKNLSPNEKPELYVTLMAQEI
jgi:hypothetical protein